jgi:hypothetical protein
MCKSALYDKEREQNNTVSGLELVISSRSLSPPFINPVPISIIT